MARSNEAGLVAGGTRVSLRRSFDQDISDSERIMPEETQFATRSTRGFASMDLEKRRAIARKGGESVPNEKRSFSQNHQLASQAGRKGGQSVDPEKRSFSQNHGLAAQAGRKGGHASHGGTRTLKPDH